MKKLLNTCLAILILFLFVRVQMVQGSSAIGSFNAKFGGAAGGPSYLFFDGFETNSFSLWDNEDDTNNQLEVQSSIKQTDTYAMHYVTSSTTQGFVDVDLGSAQADFYVKWSYYLDEDATLGADKSLMIIRVRDIANNEIVFLKMLSNGSGVWRGWQIFYDLDGSTPFVTWYTAGAIVKDTWVDVVLRYKISSGADDGIVELWVDGTKRIDLTGLDNDTIGGGDELEFGVVGTHTLTTTTLDIYFDDVIINATDPS